MLKVQFNNEKSTLCLDVRTLFNNDEQLIWNIKSSNDCIPHFMKY